MNIRSDNTNKVLKYLLENKNESISGEKIAKSLGISRTAVWQCINKLKMIGHEIESNGNKGYKYIETDVMSEEGIRYYLPKKLKDIPIKFYDIIDSTNKQAKIEATGNIIDKTLYITPYQTAGRGRFGRSFIGDENGGIYMSIVLRPNEEIEDIPLITIKTAVAEKRAIDKLAKIDTKIKWVNDLYYKNKKISGILTEGVTDYETGTISTIIIGIGINYSIKSFPEDIKNIAGSIFDSKPKDVTRNELVALFLKEFYKIYDENDHKKLIEEYKKASFVLGKKVSFIKNNTTYTGKAIDIDDKGELIVELDNKKTVNLYSGEISIKMK